MLYRTNQVIKRKIRKTEIPGLQRTSRGERTARIKMAKTNAVITGTRMKRTKRTLTKRTGRTPESTRRKLVKVIRTRKIQTGMATTTRTVTRKGMEAKPPRETRTVTSSSPHPRCE